MDLSLRYFLRDHASRDTNAPAFLATLLDYVDAFRGEFMALLGAVVDADRPG